MTEAAEVTPADIEAKFRDIQGQIEVVAEDSKKKVAVLGTVAAVVVLLVVYLLGRRAGTRRSSVIEIRRL